MAVVRMSGQTYLPSFTTSCTQGFSLRPLLAAGAGSEMALAGAKRTSY